MVPLRSTRSVKGRLLRQTRRQGYIWQSDECQPLQHFGTVNFRPGLHQQFCNKSWLNQSINSSSRNVFERFQIQ